MYNHSYENEFNLHVNEISFSYEKMGTKTHFEEEAKGNSEMAYSMASTCLNFQFQMHPSHPYSQLMKINQSITLFKCQSL